MSPAHENRRCGTPSGKQSDDAASTIRRKGVGTTTREDISPVQRVRRQKRASFNGLRCRHAAHYRAAAIAHREGASRRAVRTVTAATIIEADPEPGSRVGQRAKRVYGDPGRLRIIAELTVAEPSTATRNAHRRAEHLPNVIRRALACSTSTFRNQRAVAMSLR